MSNGSQKLFIIQGKAQGKRVKFDAGDKSSVIEICFNPTEYSLDKRVNYSEANIPGLGTPILQFSHGNTRTLSVELMLDTYREGKGEDLRERYIQTLEKLVGVDSELHAPPPCKVLWGSLEFDGVVDSFAKRYLLFLEDGTPVRARVTMGFKEYIPVEIQVRATPFSSPDRLKSRVVTEGDSLWQLADQAYGDAGLWRILANANNITDPRQLPIGTEIIIPPLEGE